MRSQLFAFVSVLALIASACGQAGQSGGPTAGGGNNVIVANCRFYASGMRIMPLPSTRTVSRESCGRL